MLQGGFDHEKSFFHTPKASKAQFDLVFNVLMTKTVTKLRKKHQNRQNNF